MLSSLAKQGSALILDQVNYLFESGISMRPRLPIRSLKTSLSQKLKSPLVGNSNHIEVFADNLGNISLTSKAIDLSLDVHSSVSMFRTIDGCDHLYHPSTLCLSHTYKMTPLVNS